MCSNAVARSATSQCATRSMLRIFRFSVQPRSEVRCVSVSLLRFGSDSPSTSGGILWALHRIVSAANSSKELDEEPCGKLNGELCGDSSLKNSVEKVNLPTESLKAFRPPLSSVFGVFLQHVLVRANTPHFRSDT